MNNDTQFKKNIIEWVGIDNKIKDLTNQLKILRDNRSLLVTDITSYASNHNLLNSNMIMNDSKLKFGNSHIYEPLTFKYLEKTLTDVIRNETQVKLIMEHLKNKRNIQVVQEIKRIYNK